MISSLSYTRSRFCSRPLETIYSRRKQIMESKPTSDKLWSLYRNMLQIRRTEEQLAKLYAAGLVHGACHTYVGEEAVATGVCAHLRPGDMVFSTHRGHGH